jgi:hypothetical protein
MGELKGDGTDSSSAYPAVQAGTNLFTLAHDSSAIIPRSTTEAYGFVTSYYFIEYYNHGR